MATVEIPTTAPAVETLTAARREHEVFVEVVSFTPWHRCSHGKQLVTVKAHWSNTAPWRTTAGREDNSEQWFTRAVHADNSPSGDYESNVITRCPSCEQVGTLITKQLAYGDSTTCSTEGCTYSTYYSIGD